MAIHAVVSIVGEKLESEMTLSFTNGSGQLEKTRGVLLKAAAGFSGSSNDGANSDQIKERMSKYVEILYDAEDAIESFSLQIPLQRKRFGFLMNHSLFRFFACKPLKLDRIQRKLKDLDRGRSGPRSAHSRLVTFSPKFNTVTRSSKLNEVNEDREAVNGEEMTRNGDYEADKTVTETDLSSTSNSFNRHSLRKDSLLRERLKQGKFLYSNSFDEEQSMSANKEVLHNLLGRLAGNHSNIGGSVIHIGGEPGSGKTLLARAVYGNKLVKEKFKDYCAWVCVYKECTTLNILKKLLIQVEKSKEDSSRALDEENENLIRSRLKDVFTSRKYLIVLDGVQKYQWDNLKGAFPDEHQKGSSIIVTTSDLDWADQMRPFRLKKLNSVASWELFSRTAGLTETETEKCTHLSTLKQRLYDICGGLPLNIVLLGSLVSTKEGERLEDLMKTLNSRQNWDNANILLLVYNDLDVELKLCLLYMTLFPKDLDVPVRRLQRLWLAEGFAKQPESGDKFKEDVVEDYFDSLVSRSLILVSKQRSDGSPRKCRLMGALQDFLLDKAKELNLYHCHHGSTTKGKPRRLIQFADGKDCSLTPDAFHNLRSYISFNIQKKDIQAKDVGKLLSHMIGKNRLGLLRVLDLEGVYKPTLPENLGDLLNLRYLGLRWTFLDKLPKSVGELLYLENLDIKHTNINKIPPSIWKLKHLRHLNLNGIHLPNDMRLDSDDSFPKLLTLCGLCIDHKSPVMNVLSKMKHLRELDISFRHDNDGSSGSETLTQLVDWISNLTSLCSLRLLSQYNSGRPAELRLKSFAKLDKLSHMRLYGKLPSLPGTGDLPPNIKALTLSVSGLTEDPMSILGHLKCLTVLRLLGNSYHGDKLVCRRDTFKALQVLKLWKLDRLTEWESEEGSMAKLKEVNIRLCPNLQSIPDRILKQKSFKYLTLTNMPEKFRRQVEQVADQVSITEKNFNFSTPPYWDQVQDTPNVNRA